MMEQHFVVKRPRPGSSADPVPKIGEGKKLRVVQRMNAIVDVSGDTQACKEALLKPLGFQYVSSNRSWRWDGKGDAQRDPTAQLLRKAEEDGVAIEHVDYRPRGQAAPISARAELRRLMDSPEPSANEASQEAAGSSAPPNAPSLTPSIASATAVRTSPRSSVPSSFDQHCLPDHVLLSIPLPPPNSVASGAPPTMRAGPMATCPACKERFVAPPHATSDTMCPTCSECFM